MTGEGGRVKKVQGNEGAKVRVVDDGLDEISCLFLKSGKEEESLAFLFVGK